MDKYFEYDDVWNVKLGLHDTLDAEAVCLLLDLFDCLIDICAYTFVWFQADFTDSISVSAWNMSTKFSTQVQYMDNWASCAKVYTYKFALLLGNKTPSLHTILL